ncbi:zf-HC2 domain-containing protein [Butyricicoccus sp.]|uniref:zf-HC2 domain-containing protein n=1 Tax=Butyricicoccus sp. TaxID=2049021 RepID=UPI003F14D27C
MKRIDCEVIRDLLPLYVEDMASEASRRLVEEHLEECEDCRRKLEEMRAGGTEKKPVYSSEPLRELRRQLHRHTAVAVSVTAFVMIGIGLLIWSFCIDGSDAFGYSLIAMYLVLPLASCVCCIFAGRSGSRLKWLVPLLFAVGIAGGIYFIFHSFELFYVAAFALVPALIGLGIGLAIRRSELPEDERRASTWTAWAQRHRQAAVFIRVAAVAAIVLICLFAAMHDDGMLSVVLSMLLLPVVGLVSSLDAGRSDSRYKYLVPLAFPAAVLCTPLRSWFGGMYLVLFITVPALLGLVIGLILHRKKE